MSVLIFTLCDTLHSRPSFVITVFSMYFYVFKILSTVDNYSLNIFYYLKIIWLSQLLKYAIMPKLCIKK